MAVPKGERGITSKAFMNAAERLHDDIIKLLLRDFGAKPIKRLKKHKCLIDQGRMTLTDAQVCYRGWRGCYKKLDSKKEIRKLDAYFKKIFGAEWYDIKSGRGAVRPGTNRAGTQNNKRTGIETNVQRGEEK